MLHWDFFGLLGRMYSVNEQLKETFCVMTIKRKLRLIRSCVITLGIVLLGSRSGLCEQYLMLRCRWFPWRHSSIRVFVLRIKLFTDHIVDNQNVRISDQYKLYCDVLDVINRQRRIFIFTHPPLCYSISHEEKGKSWVLLCLLFAFLGAVSILFSSFVDFDAGVRFVVYFTVVHYPGEVTGHPRGSNFEDPHLRRFRLAVCELHLLFFVLVSFATFEK